MPRVVGGVCENVYSCPKWRPDIMKIDERGFWITSGPLVQKNFDEALAVWLTQSLTGSVGDLGCGSGRYTNFLNNRGISCRGYDGNPSTGLIENCEVADLTTPLDLPIFDWVVCLEVAEHIPSRYEYQFIKNVHKHNKKGIILSWAKRGQGGTGHVNCRDATEVLILMELLGYSLDDAMTKDARETAILGWYKSNILVLRRI